MKSKNYSKSTLKITACLMLFVLIVDPAFAVYDDSQVNQNVSGPLCDFNGICDGAETYETCSNDCPSPTVCGNGTCETGEDSVNCLSDCPVSPGGGAGAPPDKIPPVISGLQIDKLTINSVAISWLTDEQALCKFFWGRTVGYGEGAISENVFSRGHKVSLDGLFPDMLYHFKVLCKDTAENSSETRDHKFSTLPLPDTTPPANVGEFEAESGDGEVKLKWENPDDKDFKGVRILRSDKFFPLDPWDGALVYEGEGEEILDAGLINNARYYYTAFAYDSAGNFSSGAIASAIPRKTAVPGEEEPIPVFPPEFPEAPEIPKEIRDLLDELTLKDFEFWQGGKMLEIVNDKVTAKPESSLKILLKYEKVPEVLKTIAINFLRDDGKSFAFLLKINREKMAYFATLVPPDPQEYGMKIQVLDYKNQRLKKIDGKLEIEPPPARPLTFWKKTTVCLRQYLVAIFISLLFLLLLFLLFLWFLRKNKGNKGDKVN